MINAVTHVRPSPKHLVTCAGCGISCSLLPRKGYPTAWSEDTVCEVTRHKLRIIYFCRACGSSRIDSA